MFFALLTKNRERNMATPEETRDRIKEMRDRIFKDSDKEPAQNNIQETSQKNNLAEKKPKVSQRNESPSDTTKPAKPQEESSSERPQQSNDKISLLSADTKKHISEIVLEFTGKLSSLETAILEKLEHTFSEMITDFDLVKLQIGIAAGEKLKISQKDISVRGHAIQCRINAEHPKTFIPSPGKITEWGKPGGIGVRVDSHVYDGCIISPYYDALIAKICTQGKDLSLIHI